MTEIQEVHNMKTRRLSAAVMALLMAASLASCGSTDSSANDIVTSGSVNESTVISDQGGAANGGSGKENETLSSEDENSEQGASDDRCVEEASFCSSDAPLDEEYKQASYDFAAELFKKVYSTDEGKNVMVSPASVMQALALAANGANGETLAEFEKLLGGKLTMDEINKNLRSQITSILNSEDVKFNAANSIWARETEGFFIRDDYRQHCRMNLNAESYVTPFDQTGVDKINAWIEKNTNGMIPKVLDSLSYEDLCVLVNCIAFEGEWNSEYSESSINENGKFTNASGEQEDCTMLSSVENEYFSDRDVQGFAKYYKGNQYKFVALLPNESTTLDKVAESMTGEKLSELLGSANRNFNVNAEIPEFKFDYGVISIASKIRDMGLKSAFTNSADFTKMSETPLYIGDILHKTHIELDRKGTRAAAATVIRMKTTSIERPKDTVTVKLDRPFMFAIVDANTNLPVFIGTVNSVKQ